jgi:hypothetical protein
MKIWKMLILGAFWPPTPWGNDLTKTNIDGWLDLNPPPQRCIPNMKKKPSKLWSVASGNQTVSGGGSRQDQNQSIPNFIRGYNYQILETKPWTYTQE